MSNTRGCPTRGECRSTDTIVAATSARFKQENLNHPMRDSCDRPSDRSARQRGQSPERGSSLESEWVRAYAGTMSDKSNGASATSGPWNAAASEDVIDQL